MKLMEILCLTQSKKNIIIAIVIKHDYKHFKGYKYNLFEEFFSLASISNFCAVSRIESSCITRAYSYREFNLIFIKDAVKESDEVYIRSDWVTACYK